MKKIAKFVIAALLLLVGVPQVHAQKMGATDKVDYILVIDASGKRNMYLEGIQQSIDSFYVAASRHDDLHVYNFATSLVEAGDTLSEEFCQYSDIARMFRELAGVIRNSEDNVVRVYIVSDFFNDEPVAGDHPLVVDTLTDIREEYEHLTQLKDLEISFMLLPPSSRMHGYTLTEAKALMPLRMNEYAVTPDSLTTEFMLREVKRIDQLRGLDEQAKETGSPVVSIIVLSLFILAVAGAVVYFFIVKRKKN